MATVRVSMDIDAATGNIIHVLDKDGNIPDYHDHEGNQHDSIQIETRNRTETGGEHDMHVCPPGYIHMIIAGRHYCFPA